MPIASAASTPVPAGGFPKPRLWLLLVPALALYLVLFVWPMMRVIATSFHAQDALSLEQYSKFFQSSFYRGVLWRSIRLSVIVTAATLVTGYPVAWYLAQPGRRGRTLVTFLVIAPMLICAVARSYGWIIILGPNGVLKQMLGAVGIRVSHLLYTETGVAIALTHVFLPYMVLAIAGSLQQIDPSLIRASQNLGANWLQTFWRVILPLSRPGIAAGVVIVFCLTASGFVTPALVGGSAVPVMPYLVYKQGLLTLNWQFASAVAVLLLVVTALITGGYSLWAFRAGKEKAR